MWRIIKQFFHQFVSPKKLIQIMMPLLPWINLACFCLLTYGLIGGLYLSPADYQQGDAFRIIYLHAPAAFLSLFIYGVMAVTAFCHLAFRIKIAPAVIAYSAETGILFTLIALITGSLWGKPMWGTWWIWDARLTSELILAFLYTGILLFSRAIRTKRSGDKALSILILVGFIDIPIIHYSVYWWNTLHQGATLTILTPPKIDGSMLYPLLSMMGAFLCYYASILITQLAHELIVIQQNEHWLRRPSS